MKRRIAFVALFASILVPSLVGVPMLLIGEFDHILWMRIAGLVLVIAAFFRSQVVFPLMQRNNHPVGSAREEGHDRPVARRALADWPTVGFVIGWVVAWGFLAVGLFVTPRGDPAKWAWFGAFVVILGLANLLRWHGRRLRHTQQ